MADEVYDEGSGGDTTVTSYPLMAGAATFSGSFSPAKLVSGFGGSYYQDDEDYFGIPIGSSGVEPGQTLRFTISGLPSGSHFVGQYAFVSPGQRPDFDSNVQVAISNSSGIITIPANVDPNATLVFQLVDDNSETYGYGVSWTGGASGGGSGSGPTPTPISYPDPIGQMSDGVYVYELGKGIANVAPKPVQAPLPTQLHRALAYLRTIESETSPGSGSISLNSWGLNDEVVGAYTGPDSFPVNFAQMQNGTNTVQLIGTDEQTGEEVALQSPVTITKGITDQPYTLRIDDALGDYLNGNEDVTSSLDIKRNGQIYARETTTRILDTDEVTDVKDFRDLINEYNENMETDQYDGSGNLQSVSVEYKDSTSLGVAYQSGQTLTADPFATLYGQGVGNTTFVFDAANYGSASVQDMLVSGSNHDTINLSAADFGGIAGVLYNTSQVNGSSVITDPVTKETITLQNVSTAQLQHSRADFSFT